MPRHSHGSLRSRTGPRQSRVTAPASSGYVRAVRFPSPPAVASYVHRDSRAGFEIAFFADQDGGRRVTGQTTAVEGASPWSVGYDIALESTWATRSAEATLLSPRGVQHLLLLRQPGGAWSVDGQPRSDLDGCIDVDFESSAVTNTLPIRRLDFARGIPVDLPAVFIRAEDLRVERLEQSYTLLDRRADGLAFHYESSTFEFECELRYDDTGLIVDYPGIARRHS